MIQPSHTGTALRLLAGDAVRNFRSSALFSSAVRPKGTRVFLSQTTIRQSEMFSRTSPRRKRENAVTVTRKTILVLSLSLSLSLYIYIWYDDNAPTTTFPKFSGKHTLFIYDSDDDKGKGVARPLLLPPKRRSTTTRARVLLRPPLLLGVVRTPVSPTAMMTSRTTSQ